MYVLPNAESPFYYKKFELYTTVPTYISKLLGNKNFEKLYKQISFDIIFTILKTICD